MTQTIALVPALCPTILEVRSRRILSIATGVLFLALLARLRLSLPFTPVPITGQTLGVTLLSLILGRRLGVSVVGVYLIAGLCGAPVLAGGAAWSSLSPTSGYLVGMMASSWVVGGLADRGATRSLPGSFLAAGAGSLCVYAFGLAGLFTFVPGAKLLSVGVLPFLPGDAIKTTLACLIARSLDRRQRNQGE